MCVPELTAGYQDISLTCKVGAGVGPCAVVAVIPGVYQETIRETDLCMIQICTRLLHLSTMVYSLTISERRSFHHQRAFDWQSVPMQAVSLSICLFKG